MTNADNNTNPARTTRLKVHKIENFFGSDFEFCVILLLVIVPLTLALLNLLKGKVWAVVNPQLIPKHKHCNTLCGMFLLYPSLTELPSIEIN